MLEPDLREEFGYKDELIFRIDSESINSRSLRGKFYNDKRTSVDQMPF